MGRTTLRDWEKNENLDKFCIQNASLHSAFLSVAVVSRTKMGNKKYAVCARKVTWNSSQRVYIQRKGLDLTSA